MPESSGEGYVSAVVEMVQHQAEVACEMRDSESREDGNNNEQSVPFKFGIPLGPPPVNNPRFLPIFYAAAMPDQELSRHEGEVDVFDISPDGMIEEECKSHKLGDIVLSIISAYDPKALQDFLDFKKIQSFTFLYPGGYIFLPMPHLMILREGSNVLIGRYQDSTRYFHWQPQILFEIDERGRWTILSAVRIRDEVVSGNMMSSAKDLNVSRSNSGDSQFYQIADTIADLLIGALLTSALKPIIPIVEIVPAVERN